MSIRCATVWLRGANQFMKSTFFNRVSISKFKRRRRIAAWQSGRMATNTILVNLPSWQRGRVATKS